MFLHKHPYEPFIQSDTEKLICGTLPPPRFTTRVLLKNDVDFCYGSYYNSLWKYIDKIHNLDLLYDNSLEAVNQRKKFLIENKIGVCDIVESCEREKIDASDLGMTNIKLRDLVGYLRKFPSIKTILFIGGNSKNGPEYFFRKHLKEYNSKLELVDKATPKIHKFCHPIDKRVIKTVSLTSSSGAANLSIGSNADYKARKLSDPEYTTFDFRVDQYKHYF